eukprot:CAMPEP_0184690820 /NCGR_PEP_ID=MMETSP0312-20130426/31452_1 /TAXON_ID=31354 /ORGANISM="Compsopogon coeruleus, Strain SAG 36.94" /LENGTH=31 /DNA_ID= /DNA_START= /DNA_END= /DNA_ORIENTATION=
MSMVLAHFPGVSEDPELVNFGPLIVLFPNDA